MTALLEQVLEGMSVGTSESVCCDSCNSRLYEGSEVTVYAYRKNEIWELTRVHCANCSKTGISSPTLGVEELVAMVRLCVLQDMKDFSSRIVVREPEIIAYISEDKGVKEDEHGSKHRR